MPRPPSIQRFELLYLGSLALFLVTTALFWTQAQAQATAMPQLQANPALLPIISAVMIVSVVLTTGVSLLFWWLVARKRSEVGKWLVVGTEVIGALGALLALVQLATHSAPSVTAVVLKLVVTGLAIAAAVTLFAPDATTWFAGPAEPEGRY